MFANITDLIGNAVVSATFGSPDIAGLVLLGLIVFFCVKFRVAIDGILVLVGITVFSLMALGIFQMLFLPMVAAMLFIIGMGLVRIFKR